MANLKQLKLKRQSVNKTRKVTRAMEAVSAVKMRKSQQHAIEGRAFATVALRILQALQQDLESAKHPLIEDKKAGKIGLVIISSDKGLAGSLNSAVIKKASEFIDKNSKDNVVAIAIGKRAYEFLRRLGIEIVHYQENKKDDISLEDSRSFIDILIKLFNDSYVSSWYISYMNFINTFEQRPILRQILPLSKAELRELVDDILPSKGLYASSETNNKKGKKPYLIESDSEDMITELLTSLINVMLHHALLESKASEHSARMVAMKSATDKAGEISHELLLKFNKARQAAITREVSEITSGVEAMKD